MTKNSPPNSRSYSTASIRNGLVAGYAAGFCGIVVGHPLDSIKVLLQTNGGVGNSGSNVASLSSGSTSSSHSQQGFPKSSNAETAMTRAAAQSSQTSASSNISASTSKANVSTTAGQPTKPSLNSILGQRSLRALYAGVTGPLLSAGVLQSVNFAIYDSVRRVLYQRQLQSEHRNGAIHSGQHNDYLYYDNLSNVAIASFATGASTSILTSPMVLVKTKQQIMVWGFRKAITDTYHIGSVNGSPTFLKGMRNFYTGFGVHFFCDAFGRAVYFTSYEMFKRKLAQTKSNDQTSDIFNNQVSTSSLSLAERMMCAATAGMTCWAIIFPADVIRSRLYLQSLNQMGHRSSSMQLNGFELTRQIVKEQGVKSLYRGMGITVARAGPVAAAVLPVYDSVLNWLTS